MTRIEKKLKNCLSCGNEYEAHIGHIAGMALEFGHGYCPKCREIKREEEEQQEAKSRLAKLKNQREHWRLNCGIPLRFQPSRFNRFDLKVVGNIHGVWSSCKDYANKFMPYEPRKSPSLVLYSSNIWGVGKTHLVCSIAHMVLDRWEGKPEYCPVRFISEPQLFLRVRSTYNRKGGETEDEIYQQLLSTPLLILDDVGKEEVSDSRFVQRVLFAVIDGRYQNMLPIIITTNLDVDGLDKHLGGDRNNSASMDRLAEMTDNKFIEIVGKSYRDVKNRNPYFHSVSGEEKK